MSGRNPNTVCDNCGEPIYRRPSHRERFENKFCSPDCMGEYQRLSRKSCRECGDEFQPSHSKIAFCSTSCGNKARKGIEYNPDKDGPPQKNKRRLWKLAQHCDGVDECMVEGCDYNTLYDVHRHVPGRDGGEYVIGNMFAICPNHHAEIERDYIKVEPKDNCRLKIVERQAEK